jgi:hypothetical protein
MNYRLYDGTVRCGDHMDASSYQGLTSEACLYCGETCRFCDQAPHSGLCTPAPAVQRFEAIFSHPDTPEVGVVAHVDAPSAGWAQDEANRCVTEPGNLWEGYRFTIWPDPVSAV